MQYLLHKRTTTIAELGFVGGSSEQMEGGVEIKKYI